MAGSVIVAVMAVAFVYQSRASVPCGFGCALAAFYWMHRLLVRRKVRAGCIEPARNTSAKLQRDLADLFSSGKEIRTYRNLAFFLLGSCD